MPEPNNPLEQLRDLHYPDPITELPIAFGWWIVLLLSIALVLSACYLAYTLIKKNQYRREANKSLTYIYSNHLQDKNDQQFVFNINALLKATALKQYPADVCGSLSGTQWQEFLMSSLPKKLIVKMAAFDLLSDVYQAEFSLSATEIDQLKVAAALWIKQHIEYSKLYKNIEGSKNV